MAEHSPVLAAAELGQRHGVVRVASRDEQWIMGATAETVDDMGAEGFALPWGARKRLARESM